MFTHENKDIFTTFLINKFQNLCYYKYIKSTKYNITVIIKNAFVFHYFTLYIIIIMYQIFYILLLISIKKMIAKIIIF